MEDIRVSTVFNRVKRWQIARDLFLWHKEHQGVCSSSLTIGNLIPLKTEQQLIPTSLSSDTIYPQVLFNLRTPFIPYLSTSSTCRGIRLSSSLIKSLVLLLVLVRIYWLDGEGSPWICYWYWSSFTG